MLVFGDLERDEDAAAVAAEIKRRLARCDELGPGLARHQALVAAFVRASELVQGALDAEFHRTGHDTVGPLQDAGIGLLRVLADAMATSWDNGFAGSAPHGWGEHLGLLSAAGPIRTRQAEGYAFYAVYPEAYLAAARQSLLRPQTTVIGIRSIGAGLAALVASALGTTAVYTVRPVGPPFDRRLALSEPLAGRLRAASGPFAIVDEGPGLSGSSFNCVADWLVAQGVAEDRVHFFPSHGGALGQAARADHRQRWAQAHKHVVSFDDLILNAARSEHRLESWIASAIGPLQAGLRDLSGGRWRALRDASLSPVAADPGMERRKYLALTHHGSWIGKFVGIGTSGEACLTLGRRMAGAGFGPNPAGLCHGFLVNPWVEDVRSTGETVPLGRLVDYLAFRASLRPDRPGATLDQLFAMAAYNIGQLWGEPAERAVREALGDPGRVQSIPCSTDNRMHAWEWVRSAQGWMKLDALDHHAAHDLVGCQDIAWDIAGASVELGLDPNARDALAEAVAARLGRGLRRDSIAAHELCYLGFQLGLWSMALDRAPDADRDSIRQLLRRYGAHPSLQAILAEGIITYVK